MGPRTEKKRHDYRVFVTTHFDDRGVALRSVPGVVVSGMRYVCKEIFITSSN